MQWVNEGKRQKRDEKAREHIFRLQLVCEWVIWKGVWNHPSLAPSDNTNVEARCDWNVQIKMFVFSRQTSTSICYREPLSLSQSAEIFLLLPHVGQPHIHAPLNPIANAKLLIYAFICAFIISPKLSQCESRHPCKGRWSCCSAIKPEHARHAVWQGRRKQHADAKNHLTSVIITLRHLTLV